MKEVVEKEKLRIEEFLKESMEHQDKKVDYILYKSDTNETNTLCSNSSSEEAIEFTPITKNYPEGYCFRCQKVQERKQYLHEGRYRLNDHQNPRKVQRRFR